MLTPPRASGFTIIELLVVVTISAILLSIAGPNLRDLVVRMRLKTFTTDLHASLTLARSEAIKRNAGMQIVPANATDWTQGWSVQIQSSGTVLSRQDPYKDISVRTANAAYTTASVPNVTFSNTGRETGSAGAGIAFVVSSSQYASIAARCVILDPSGRPAVRIDHDGNQANGCN